jgi:hypothetical protein
MKKVILNIVIAIYAIIAITITVCLLSYNDYKVTMFGSTSLVIIDNESLKPDYVSGDLVLVDRDKEIEIGDEIFFYNSQAVISLAKVTEIQEVTDTQTTYVLEGDKPISSDVLIGNAKDTKVIGMIGNVLRVLESKWGFLILVVLPAVLAFLYEVFEVIAEFRRNKRNGRSKTGDLSEEQISDEEVTTRVGEGRRKQNGRRKH